eukprot:375173-Pleurochrysis_carterae.AAC.1
MSVPTHMINGGNADTLGESNLLSTSKKRIRPGDANKENNDNAGVVVSVIDVDGDAGDQRRLAYGGGGVKKVTYVGVGGNVGCNVIGDANVGGGRGGVDGDGGGFDGLGLREDFIGVVNGGNCEECNIVKDQEKSFGYGCDDDDDGDDSVDAGDADGGNTDGSLAGHDGVGSKANKRKAHEEALDVARMSTTATSTTPLHIGGGAGGDEKYRARPLPKKGRAPSETCDAGGVAAVSDIGRAAAAMEGFTSTYMQQSMMDRAAAQQDAAAARELVKAELQQQKEIAQGCKQM